MQCAWYALENRSFFYVSIVRNRTGTGILFSYCTAFIRRQWQYVLVPYGKCIVVMSSLVNVPDHNPKTVYCAYGWLQQQYPFDQAIINLQLIVVEV